MLCNQNLCLAIVSACFPCSNIQTFGTFGKRLYVYINNFLFSSRFLYIICISPTSSSTETLHPQNETLRTSTFEYLILDIMSIMSVHILTENFKSAILVSIRIRNKIILLTENAKTRATETQVLYTKSWTTFEVDSVALKLSKTKRKVRFKLFSNHKCASAIYSK